MTLNQVLDFVYYLPTLMNTDEYLAKRGTKGGNKRGAFGLGQFPMVENPFAHQIYCEFAYLFGDSGRLVKNPVEVWALEMIQKKLTTKTKGKARPKEITDSDKTQLSDFEVLEAVERTLHQVMHCDGQTNGNEMAACQSLRNRAKPCTSMIVLEHEWKINVGNDNNTVTVMGEHQFWWLGGKPHQGYSRPFDENRQLWHGLAIHFHTDSELFLRASNGLDYSTSAQTFMPPEHYRFLSTASIGRQLEQNQDQAAALAWAGFVANSGSEFREFRDSGSDSCLRSEFSPEPPESEYSTYGCCTYSELLRAYSRTYVRCSEYRSL